MLRWAHYRMHYLLILPLCLYSKSSFKPDSALIGRFQSLYDKTMIGRPADSHDAKIQSSEGQDGVTPSLG